MIGPKFFEGPRVTPGKVYGWSNFQKFAYIKILFLKILKIHDFFLNSAKFFILFYNLSEENMFTNKIEYGRP